MHSNNNYLCCCEYIDKNQDTNHMLACCCNCQDFDEGFESFITGRGFPQRNKMNVLSTVQDRLRIPWIGGAKRILPEVVLSILFVPGCLILSANGPISTIILFIFLLIAPIIVQTTNYCALNRAIFHSAWFGVSLVTIFVIFEFHVIPFLEILVHENLTLFCMILGAYVCFYKTRNYRRGNDARYACPHCQNVVPRNCEHCYWLRCCIGPHNMVFYLSGLVLIVMGLLYQSNLTLTTVCHPYMWIAGFLLPDDCSFVYDMFELALAFVSGAYSLILACVFSVMLVRQVIMLFIRRRTDIYMKLPDNSDTIQA